jgi:hypothetical protein
VEVLGSPLVLCSGPDGTTTLSGPEVEALGRQLDTAIKYAFTVRDWGTPQLLLDFAIAVNRAARSSAGSRSLPMSGAVGESAGSPGNVPGASSAETVRVSEAARLAGVSDRWLREQIQRGSVSALRGPRGALLVQVDSLTAWMDARNRKESECRKAA